jgi:hypothetical protein
VLACAVWFNPNQNGIPALLIKKWSEINLASQCLYSQPIFESHKRKLTKYLGHQIVSVNLSFIITFTFASSTFKSAEKFL